MTLRLWTCADHHAAFRCGGWAWVRAEGTELAAQNELLDGVGDAVAQDALPTEPA